MQPVLTAIILAFASGLLAWTLFRRFAPLFAMQPDIRWDRPKERFAGMLAYGFGQLRLLGSFERFQGIAHILIFWGAIVVSVNTVHVVGRGFVTDWHLPGMGHTGAGLAYAFLRDLFTLAVMTGCVLAFYNRVFNRPSRMLHTPEALIILLWIFSMMAMDWLYHSTLFVLEPAHFEQQAAFLGVFGKNRLYGTGLADDAQMIQTLHLIGFWGHILLALSFLNYLPYCKQFHEITSIPTLFMRSLKPPGALLRQDFEDEDASFGVGRIEDFSWKRGLDMYTCAECGRCRANCPAYLTGKPLSPMGLIMDEREHLKAKTPLMWRSAAAGYWGDEQKAAGILDTWEGASLIGGVVDENAVWSCTTCGHCIVNCPLMIEHVDNIVDLRRQLVQVEARFPRELHQAFKGFENLSNPWGLAANSRGDWFADFSVSTPAETAGFEYLFYAGCAGSFDDRAKKTSHALVRLMQHAGVDFTCLGNDEACCGETVRRLGNEYVAQAMITANIEQFQALSIKKIVTACPHCFNTFKHEYPQFGGHFQVIHHTELIRHLIDEGRLAGGRRVDGIDSVVYHDACYLGRYNALYEHPRNIVGFVPGIDLVEAGQNKQTGFCCGGGGGRMWMEERIGIRINHVRCTQLLDTGAATIATACPYCRIMLDDALKELDRADDVKVLDLAVIVDQCIGT